MNTNGTTKTEENPVQLIANALNQVTAQIQRERLARALGQQMFDAERDLDEALGYPSILTFNDFYSFYRRDKLAKRLNNLPANECWRKPPIIIDGESKTRFTKEEKKQAGGKLPDDSEFITALNGIISRLHLWKYLHRADKMSGIGQYGVILIGSRSTEATPTGQTILSQPALPDSMSSPDDILFLRVLSEGSATITESDFENNTASPRFGLPMFYRVQLGQTMGQQPVHWTRIIHIAEELEENELFGVPRLEDAYNMLLAIKMTWGASGEAVWRGAFKKIAASINSEVDFDSDAQDTFETQLEALIHGLKQWIYAQGVESFQEIGSDIQDITGIFDVLISLISGNIPKHILLGTQQGLLASAQQDARHWSSYINFRRSTFCEPVILRPLIDRLIEYGALPEPMEGEYRVEWESNFELDEMQKADVRKVEAEAQEIEWDSANIPPLTRWRESRGDEMIGELEADFEQSDEMGLLGPEVSNFEPGIAQ